MLRYFKDKLLTLAQTTPVAFQITYAEAELVWAAAAEPVATGAEGAWLAPPEAAA